MKLASGLIVLVVVAVLVYQMPHSYAMDDTKVKSMEQICEAKARDNKSLTFAEQLHKTKTCMKDARTHLENAKALSSAENILVRQVRDCQSMYPMYEAVGKDTFLWIGLSNLARHCTILYELPNWTQANADNRYEYAMALKSKLVEELNGPGTTRSS
jgi:hypothetical protein